MTTRLSEIVVDCVDPIPLGQWWAETLAWDVAPGADAGELLLRAPARDDVPAVLFLGVPEPKTAKNRVHLDLAAGSLDEQAGIVDRLVGRGATRADVGQEGTPWVVLADPEGNELCVLEPRDEYRGADQRGAGALAGITIDAADPQGLAPFWAAATGWSIASESPGAVILLPPSGRPPDLALVRVDDRKAAKLRWHLDVEPVGGTSIDEEADRLRALGAIDADVGQHDDPTTDWIVLADPEGNELCVIPPLSA
jgi:hypothetical protein